MTRLHRWATSRFGVLIWLGPFSVVAGLIWFLSDVLDISRLGVYYGSMGLVAALIALWSVLDHWATWRTQVNRRRPVANQMIALWRLRQRVLLFLIAFFGGAGGMISTFMLAPSWVTAALIFLSTGSVLIAAMWDRTDQWDVDKEIDRSIQGGLSRGS